MLLGAGEIVVVLAVALMVLGPKKMPEVARSMARFVGQLRRISDEVRAQVDDALQEPAKTSMPEHEAQPAREIEVHVKADTHTHPGAESSAAPPDVLAAAQAKSHHQAVPDPRDDEKL